MRLRRWTTPALCTIVGLAEKAGLLPKPAQSKTGEIKHILVVHLSPHIGDNVMLLPMMEALRAAWPAARIDCIVEEPMVPFLRRLELLTNVYGVKMSGGGQGSSAWREWKRTCCVLRAYWTLRHELTPDVCLVPRWEWGFRDLIMAFLTRAPRRIRLSRDFQREHDSSSLRSNDSLITELIPNVSGVSEAHRFVFLVARAGLVDSKTAKMEPADSLSLRRMALSVEWPPLAEKLGLSLGRPFAVLAPGASHPKKMWPLERWAEIAISLHAQGLCTVVMTGKDDAATAEELARNLPREVRQNTVVVAGKTSLIESTALLARASLFVGNDSGPGHLAGGLGIPCVSLFIAAKGVDPNAVFAPERVKPMGNVAVCRPTALISPCEEYCTANESHCITLIDTGTVLDAITVKLSIPVAALPD